MKENFKLIISRAELNNKGNPNKFESLKIESKNYYNGKDITVLADYILESFNGPSESLKWGLSKYSSNILLPCKTTVIHINLSMFRFNLTKRYYPYTLLIFEGHIDNGTNNLKDLLNLITVYEGAALTDLFTIKGNELDTKDSHCYAIADLGYIVLLGEDGCTPIQQILECYKSGNLMIRQSDKQNILELVNMQKYYKDSYMYT